MVFSENIASAFALGPEGPRDSYRYGEVVAYDGTNATVRLYDTSTVDCPSLVAVSVGDRVQVCIKANGHCFVAGKARGNGSSIITSEIRDGVTPSSDIWGRGYYIGYDGRTGDADQDMLGYFRGVAGPDGDQGIQFETSRVIDGTRYVNDFRLYVHDDGERKVYIGNPLAWHKGLSINGIGTTVRLAGNGSAAADELLLTTSYANVLTGKCYAAAVDGHASDPCSDYFSYNIVGGTITIKKTGVYAVAAQIYMYRGFTANDQLNWSVAVNGSRNAPFFQQIKAYVAGPYTMHSMSCTQFFPAGSVLSLVACNISGARGSVQRYETTYLNVTKL